MNQTNLRKVLLESLINPQQPGKMKVVLDANNPDYFVARASESLRVAQSEKQGSPAWNEQLITAITLLAFARMGCVKKAVTVTPTQYAEKMLKMSLQPEHFIRTTVNTMAHNTVEFEMPTAKWKATLVAFEKLKQMASGKD